MNRISEFLRSNKGRIAQYDKRKHRRINIHIDDIEPQSKKMSVNDRDEFQRTVLEQLSEQKREAFKNKVALQIHLETTSKNAPQAHTVAKNLLDLLAARRSTVAGRTKYVLYRDDSQIQMLTVSCRHGANSPMIAIEGRPFVTLLDDLELATEASREIELDNPERWYQQDAKEWIGTLKDILQDEHNVRARLGDGLYDAYFKMCRWNAQRALLSQSEIDIPILCWMYDRLQHIHTGFPGDFWSQLACDSSLRLHVGELPVRPGSSQDFQRRVGEEITRFKERWSWVIDPLVIAVALQVVVRPNPSTPSAVLHDLDNIVRDYLIPQIVPSFGTVTDHRWTIDFEELRRVSPDLAAHWGPSPTPPKSTKSGVTRYEVWRLPPVEGTMGFVSVGLVADMDGQGDLIERIDDRIRDWRSKK